MIVLQELKLNNFLSHESTHVKFGPNDKVLLDGRSGSGKSSIVEAILWCLYGRGRSDNRSLVRRGAKIASASIKLNDGATSYVITRTVSLSGKNTLVVTRKTGGPNYVAIERTGIKDTQDWIENELLHSSYELFTNSIAYPQEQENSFTKANATKRKDLLLEIVRAGSFDELYDKARRALTTNETAIAVALSKIDGLELTVREAQVYANKHDESVEELKKITSELGMQTVLQKDLEVQLLSASSVFKEIEDKKAIRDGLQDIISRLEADLKRHNRAIEEHNKIDIESIKKQILDHLKKKEEISRIEDTLREHMLAQQKINTHLSNKPQLHDYTKDIELLNQRLIPLVKDSGSCPAGDDCPFVVPIKGQIDFLSEQIAEKTRLSKEEKRAMELWEKEYTLFVPLGDTNELYARLSVLKGEVENLPRLTSAIEEYEKFENTSTDATEIVRINAEILSHNKNLTSVKEQTEELKARASVPEMARLTEELKKTEALIRDLQVRRDRETAAIAMATKAQDDIKNASEGIFEAKRGIEKANSDKESLELLKEALSPRGIKAVIIDYLVPNLEERINGVLGQISDFRIRLDTQKATVDDEGVKEGLFITAINGSGDELPLTNLSGGEGVKVSMAISEALATLGGIVGFRILDEAISSLDNESTESFVEVLIGLQEKFPQMIAISHIPEVKDCFEKRLVITKINGISKLC